jgi:hypothetical protein
MTLSTNFSLNRRDKVKKWEMIMGICGSQAGRNYVLARVGRKGP